MSHGEIIKVVSPSGMATSDLIVAIAGGLTALATGVMAIFTVRLATINKSLATLAQATQAREDKEERIRVRVTRDAVEKRLGRAVHTLRMALDEPMTLVLSPMREQWFDVPPPVEELALAFGDEAVTKLNDAFIVLRNLNLWIDHATTPEMRALYKIATTSNDAPDLFYNQLIGAALKGLGVIQQAQGTCGFKTSPTQKDTPSASNEVP